MKKDLLCLIISLITSSVYGQKASWEMASGSSAYSFAYSFLKSEAPYIYDQAASNSTVFLPAPSSGSARVSVGSTGTPSFTLMENGSKDSLKFNFSSSGTQGKFSIYNTTGASALTAYFFTLNFDNLTATRADCNLAVGNNSGSTNVFNNGSGLPSGGTTSSPEIFGFLKFTVNTTDNSKVNISYREKPDAATSISIISLPDMLDRGSSYAFVLLCNNTADDQTYTKNAIQYTVPSRSYHVWINGNRLEKATSDFNFPANQLVVNTSLNSIVLTGYNSQTNGVASNDGSVIISKLSMQFANSTLPVSLTGFKGKAELGKIRLSWMTTSERNNHHFEILRSSGVNGAPVIIGKVTGNGNSNVLTNYDFLDNSPLIGTNYYQLNQIDFDGKSTLSDMIAVKGSGFSQDNFYAYQNDNQAVMVNINSLSVDLAKLELISLEGKVISRLHAQLQKGNNAIQLFNQPLSKGIYLIKLAVNGSQSVKKIVSY